jgi:hypothetical protein
VRLMTKCMVAGCTLASLLIFVADAPVWAQVRRPATLPSQTQTTPSTSSAHAPVSATPNPGSRTVSPGALTALMQPATTTPASLNFGEMFSGDSRSLTVKIQPAADVREGDATISLEGMAPALAGGAKPVFKIAEIQVWGRPSAGNVKSATAIRAPSLASEQPRMLQSITSPPFKLHVKPGDYVNVRVDAAPVLDMFTGPTAGNYAARIQAIGPGWNANVPVAESFQGLRLGLIVTLESMEDTIYRPEPYTMHQDYPVPLRMTLINAEKSPQHVHINAMQLPTGISLPAQQLVIAAGQTTTISLPFTVQWGMGSADLGADQKAKLEITYDAGKKVLPFSFTVLPSSKRYAFHGNDGPTWSADYTIQRDGTFSFSYTVTNDNLAVNRNFAFRGTFNGTEIINVAGTAKRHSDFSGHYGWKMGFIEQNYDLMLQTPPVIKFTYKDAL